MTDTTVKRTVSNSIDRASRCERKIKAAVITIIKDEMQVDEKRARVLYKRLMEG